MQNPLNPDQIQHKILSIPDWFADEDDTTIARTFEFDDFQDAVVFINMVAKLSEQERHHPDIFLHNYNKVTVSLSTTSAGGITEKDFLLASKIDGLQSK